MSGPPCPGAVTHDRERDLATAEALGSALLAFMVVPWCFTLALYTGGRVTGSSALGVSNGPTMVFAVRVLHRFMLLAWPGSTHSTHKRGVLVTPCPGALRSSAPARQACTGRTQQTRRPLCAASSASSGGCWALPWLRHKAVQFNVARNFGSSLQSNGPRQPAPTLSLPATVPPNLCRETSHELEEGTALLIDPCASVSSPSSVQLSDRPLSELQPAEAASQAAGWLAGSCGSEHAALVSEAAARQGTARQA